MKKQVKPGQAECLPSPPHPVLLPKGRRDVVAKVVDTLSPWEEGWGEGVLTIPEPENHSGYFCGFL
jgi:hypothetical protein